MTDSVGVSLDARLSVLDDAAAALAARLDVIETWVANAQSPSGQVVPKGDLPGWRQVLAEDFDTPAAPGQISAVYPRMSTYPVGYTDTSKRGHYDPANMRAADSVCFQRLHTANGVPSVAALVPLLDPTSGKWGDTLGARVSIRARCKTPLVGYKVAWLHWPQSNTSLTDGEIDWPECNLDGSAVSGFLHHAPYTPVPSQEQCHTTATMSDWHTYTREWLPGVSLVLLLDGAEVFRSTERVPAHPMHLVLQSETALYGTAVPATTDGEIEIDWIAAWLPA